MRDDIDPERQTLSLHINAPWVTRVQINNCPERAISAIKQTFRPREE